MSGDGTARRQGGQDTDSCRRYKRAMPIYTKTGDGGDTGLFGNKRVRKHHPRIEAYGTVDELNSSLGVVAAEPLPPDLQRKLAAIQATLFDIGADLATEGGTAAVARVGRETSQLEAWIDEAQAVLQPLRTFVLPGGHREAALLHVARTVCRRAERATWQLLDGGIEVPRQHAVYLNRLSDLLFVWSRDANRRHGLDDVPWTPATSPGGS